MYNLSTLLENSAQRYPDRDAVVLGDRRLTYAQVDGAANQVANLLVARGIRHGDKVALSCPNLPYFTIIYFGILKAGATVVPLNVLLKGREVAYHLGDSDAKAYFCFEGTADLPMAKEGYAGFQQAEGCTRLLRDHRRPVGAPRRSRGLPRSRWRRSARPSPSSPRRSRPWRPTRTTPRSSSTPPAPPASPRARSCGTATCATTRSPARCSSAPTPTNPDTLLCVLPLFHSFGQTCIQNGAFAFGGTVVMLPRFEAHAALELMGREKVTYFAGVPTMYWGLLGALEDVRAAGGVDVEQLAKNLRVAAAGGAALPVEVHKDFQKKFGVTILEGYGLSETSPVASFSPRGEEVRVGSIGKPIPGVEMKLIDPEWNEVNADGSDPGAVGEIAIKGHNIMKGYYDRPRPPPR